MSQQTSIYEFYKVVNPKRRSDVKPEPISKNSSNPKNNLKKRNRVPSGSRKMTEEGPVAVTPKKRPKKTPSQAQNNPVIDLIDLVDTEDDVKPSNILCDNNLPRTPNSSDKNLKKSLSGSTGSSGSSPRKKSQTNGSRSVTKHLKNRTSRKLFHTEAIDSSQVSDMVENLNHSRAGILPKNNYDLEEYYSKMNSFPEIIEGDINSIKLVYDCNRVIIPREKHAEHLFFIITKVFLNPSNSGYFNDAELDILFNILTLSEKSQMLLARMIKRKHCWMKSSAIKYPEINDNLRPYFDELEKNKLITTEMDNENLETFLSTLSADEVREICKQSKIPRQTTKESAIKELIKTSSIKSLFPGMKSPAVVLRKTVSNAIGHCVRLSDEVMSLVDRIVTLFIPSEDVTSKISDIFLKLTLTKDGTLKYPEVPVQHYPVFENREHLLRYVERKQEWRQAMEMQKGARENWEIFKTLGRNAHRRLSLSLARNQSGIKRRVAVPRHLQKFSEEYVCIKIIISCIEIFKKDNSTIVEATRMLRDLVNQEYYLQNRKCEWYEELALIEMRYNKNPESAAQLTITGLTFASINEAGRHVLIKRASSLVRRKNIAPETKSELKNLVSKENNKITRTVSIIGSVLQSNQPGRKSTWSMDMGDGEKGYMSVEYRARHYYKNNGYPEGWHCEGSLPVTLFTLLLWDELYCVPVPAAYLSAYQKAPLDLYSSDFYNNRKEQIDQRMELLYALSADELANVVEDSFQIKQHYKSLMPTKLFVDGEQLRDIVRCMGTKVVTGICERLIENFSGHRSGFPDLLVWDASAARCKFVEVKGPGDTLSAKQTLWLRYLEDLGAVTELCEVKAK